MRLRPRREERLRAGHLWVYRGEVIAIPEIEPGGLVDILDAAGRHLGRGYFSPFSQICVRLLTRGKEPIDRTFFNRRLTEAIHLRRRLYPDATALRLVYSEADMLPGLIVDRYEDYLVVQFLTLGMETRREIILQLLLELLSPLAIQERSEAGPRKHEGLAARVGAVYGEVPDEVLVNEGNLKFLVDLRGGQKTGYFLDQRENRFAAAAYAAERRVLDCFCHSGMFGIQAARAGAVSVLGVDIDPEALSMAQQNASINGVEDTCQFLAANCFDFLRSSVEEGRKFDLVILDPPAFTKSKLRVDQALRGYKEINLRAIRLLSPRGLLVTCSCSHHIAPALFQEMILSAASDAGRNMRLLERRSQANDHPILLGVPETEYLKCFILEAIS